MYIFVGKILRKIFLSLLLFFSSAFAFSAAPKWLTDISSDFPSEKYIRAVGEGKSKDEAKNSALAELSAYFSQTVETSVKANQFLFSQTGKSSKSKSERSESIFRQINTSSISNLFSVQYTDFYYDKKQKVYSICSYIPREEAWSILEPKLEIYGRSFQSNSAKINNQTGLKKIIQISKLLESTADFEEFYFMALSIFPKRCGEYTKIMEKRQSLVLEAESLKRGIKIKINIKGDKDGRIYSKLSSLISESDFTVCKIGENHLMNVAVDIADQIVGNVHSIYPQISVEITNGAETVSSFSKSLEKVSAYNAETAQRMALSRIEEVLENEFADACFR